MIILYVAQRAAAGFKIKKKIPPVGTYNVSYTSQGVFISKSECQFSCHILKGMMKTYHRISKNPLWGRYWFNGEYFSLTEANLRNYSVSSKFARARVSPEENAKTFLCRRKIYLKSPTNVNTKFSPFSHLRRIIEFQKRQKLSKVLLSNNEIT
jgi:hypothetical protein